HRSINTHAVTDRRDRRAVAQMRNNEPQTSPTYYLRRLATAVRMAQSVETVTANAPFACPLLRQRIGSSSLGQRCMKSSIECCYLWNLWQNFLDRVNALQAGWVVQRGQLCQFFDCPPNFHSDPHSRGVTVAAMHNAMSYSSDVFGTLQSCRWASLQIVEDLSHGISVLLQLQFLADFRLAPSAKN